MAPLITVTVQALLSSVGLKDYAHNFKPCHTPASQKTFSPATSTNSLSAISWSFNRMDIYGQNAVNGTVSHKWWDGYQWGPSWDTFEDLGAEAPAAPVAVSWGKDRMDIFSRDFDGGLAHKYWDGTAWRPNETAFESLGGEIETHFAQLATTSWAENRLDVFAVGANDASLLHKYWDGSQWQPPSGMESLGGQIAAGVAAVSWGPGRLDAFALDHSGTVLHIYYDGTKWSDWEDMQAPILLADLTTTSWGDGRLDVFGVSTEDGELWHSAWDGTKWLEWEKLGGKDLVGPVAATSWGVNRLDIVALDTAGSYNYKYWDGSQWNPNDATLYPKGGSFSSLPSVVSWGENRLDIFGVTDDKQLGHQTWYGSGWWPEWGFEKLGGTLAAN